LGACRHPTACGFLFTTYVAAMPNAPCTVTDQSEAKAVFSGLY
jgi:hypothetical protein